MKTYRMFQIQANTFSERLGYAAKGVARRGTGEYALVCIERNGSGIYARSFNHVAHSLAKLSGEGGSPFRVLVNPAPLLGAVGRVSGTLEVDVDPGDLMIRVSGPVSLQSRCVEGEDYIDWPEPEVEPVPLEDEADLADSIARAVKTVDADNPNARFAGIYIGDRHSEGTIFCVGCNTTSLVEVQMADSSDLDYFKGESIIPAQSLDQMRKLLKDKATGETTSLYMDEREASVVTENYALCTRLLAEKYPNYRAILPKEKDCQLVEVSRKELTNALRICQEYTEDFSSVYLDITATSLLITSAESAENGEASYEVQADTTEEMGSMRLKASADRLLEVVTAMNGYRASIYIPIEEMPTRIRVSGEQDGVTGALALMHLQPGEEPADAKAEAVPA